jgi:probable HAF family extracellular repeat protein
MSQPAAAIRYTVTDLGTLPGYDASWPWSINNHGQIVGFVREPTPGHRRAVLFDPTGRGYNIDLGTLGGEQSDAYSINDIGQIVGWADSNDPHQGPHATLFTLNAEAENIDLGTLGGPSSAASSNNSSGQIVGCAGTPDGLHPTVFDPNAPAGNTDLGGLFGFIHSYAFCINNTGSMSELYSSTTQPQAITSN